MIVKVSLPIICIFKAQICSTLFLGSIVQSIPACHAGARNSIPRRGEICRCNGAIFWFKRNLNELSNIRKRNCKFGYQSYWFTFEIEPSDHHWRALIYLSDDSKVLTSKNLDFWKTRLHELLPRQYSGEYPRLSPGSWGSIPRRGGISRCDSATFWLKTKFEWIS